MRLFATLVCLLAFTAPGHVAAQQQRASQDLRITSVGPLQVTRCGNMSWSVNFELLKPAARAGFIIQEVDFVVDATKGIEYEHFYEAFPVAQGQRGPARSKTPGSADDTFLYVGTYSGSGSHVFDAKAKFYEGPLPADFKKDNPAVVMGQGQLTSTTRPPFWDGTGAAHVARINFNCTTSPNVQTTPAAKVVPWGNGA